MESIEGIERITKRNIDIVSFAITSSITSVLGVLVGLSAATSQKLPVVAGILAVAVSDSLADAFGIHSEREAQLDASSKKILVSTIFAFLIKLLATAVFVIPIFMLDLTSGVILDILIGFLLIFIIGFVLGKRRHQDPWKSAALHIGFALIVVLITFSVGLWVKNLK